MKRILLLMALALGILGDTTTQAQIGGVPLWTNYYNGPGNDDFATALAVDTNGNVFMTGFSTGSGSSYDYATIKYSGAGVPLWTNRYNGPENGGDQAYDVAVDTDGSVFVTGHSGDFATIKYSNAGVPLWTNLYNGPGNGGDGAIAIALDGSGNVLVTGYSLGKKIGNVDPSFDFATVKYSGAGVPLWTNRYDGSGHGDDYPFALAVDSSGNVIVAGRSPGGNFWPDYATIKYSAAGVPLWTNRFNGGGNSDDEIHAVAVDSNDNVLVTGETWSSAGNVDYATIKYSGAGVPLWTNYYSGLPSGDDYATAMALDSSGNVFVTGESHGSGSQFDYATIKYSSAGVPLWTNRYNGPDNFNDGATAVTPDGSGNVFVTGNSFGSSNGWEYATIAYSGAGVPLWTNRNRGPGGNAPFTSAGVAVDQSGNVFATGYSPGIDGSYDYVIVKYSAILPSLTIARTPTNTVAVSWPSPSTGFTLQQNTNGIATVNWSNVLTAPIDNGTSKTVIANPASGNRFYRLSSP
jgi:uncharacterized delta-60 repeat protein